MLNYDNDNKCRKLMTIYLFIFNHLTLTSKITVLTFGNETSFPRRKTTISNL